MVTLLELLISRQDELRQIQQNMFGWHEHTEWHSRCQPLIAEYFPSHLEAFNGIIAVKFQQPTINLRIGRPTLESQHAVDVHNENLIKNVHSKLSGFLATLIDIQGVSGSIQLDTQESDSIFQTVLSLIASSPIPQHIKSVISYDLVEARKANRSGAYKSCVVMLGAALEGMMLGTLLRTDALVRFGRGDNVPNLITRMGCQNPRLSDLIGEKLTFEDLRVCINDLIAGSESLGVDRIQAFRNAIHPWKAIQEPKLFGEFDRARSLHYLGSLQKIAEVLCNWSLASTPTGSRLPVG